MKSMVAIGVCGSLLLGGCASTGKDDSAGGLAARGAAIGAAAGCALSSVFGKNCREGAIAGALIGAAVGWSTYSEKVANAQAVNAEARREGAKVPEGEIRLRDYQVSISAKTAQGGGAPVQVVGDIKLFGQSSHTPEVVQSMTLFNANGDKASETPQIARVERVDGAGQYRAVGVYKIPRGMDQGLYMVQSVLYLDGKEVARRDTRFRVAGAATSPVTG